MYYGHISASFPENSCIVFTRMRMISTTTSVVLLSSLFVTVLILLLQPDSLFPWSWDELLLGQKIGIVYDGQANVVHIERTYLTMEPILWLFLIFFGVVVILQFSAMVFYRLQTARFLLQISKKHDKNNKERHIDIAKDLLKPSYIADFDESIVSRRKTLRNLMRVREIKQSSLEYDNRRRRQYQESHDT